MPNADALLIRSYPQRKVAVLRAAEILSSSSEGDGSREFELITEAIADFDIRQEALGYIEIPRAFVMFLASRNRDGLSAIEH